MKELIGDYDIEELKRKMSLAGEKPHRAGQIFRWIYKKKADKFSSMTDLPGALIKKLDESFYPVSLKMEGFRTSRDRTRKFLWRLRDEEFIESVLIKEGARRTLCVSSQVGCKIKCPFCASGKYGFKRDLSTGEITGQVLSVERIEGIRVTNVVYMGMGEPLDNFDNVVKSIRIINSRAGLELGARKITVSTCGFIPEMKKLRSIGLQVELSVSLHAVSNNVRDKLVPINRKYPLEVLIKACREHYEHTGRIVTLEYTLISGINDSLEDAAELSRIAKQIKGKVNLLVCNDIPGWGGGRISMERIKAFRQKIVAGGVTATYRRGRGSDILAACGQLAGKIKEENEQEK